MWSVGKSRRCRPPRFAHQRCERYAPAGQKKGAAEAAPEGKNYDDRARYADLFWQSNQSAAPSLIKANIRLGGDEADVYCDGHRGSFPRFAAGDETPRRWRGD
jgi:hypothetical protein